MSDDVFRDDHSEIDNTCPCIFGYMMDGEDDYACTACDENCADCEGSLTTCTDCYAGTYLTDLTAECKECHIVCETCIYYEACTSCGVDRLLDEDTAYCSCFGH